MSRITGSRTTLDLLLSPWTTSSWKRIRKNAFRSLSFLDRVWSLTRGLLCLAQVAPSDFILLNELNYGFQNDFGFAIVSVDDLDLGGSSKKCPSVVELFIQSVVTNNGLLCVMQALPSEF